MTIRFLSQVPKGWLTTSAIEPFQFPAGEWHLRLPEVGAETSKGAIVYGADVNDLVQLGLWADAMRQRGEKTVAYIPYFPAARADRGEPFGARVYAEIVNSFKLDEVVVFDPHSPVIVELINNVSVVTSARLIRQAIAGGRPSNEWTAKDNGYVGVIAPDKGAHERASAAAQHLHLPVFQASKTRDFATGKLSGFAIENLPEEGKFLIVDDICEGGGTFVGLAEAANLGPDRLDLWVSHGSFTGRAVENMKTFGTVYTTDSHPGASNPEIGAKVIPILPYLMTAK